MTSMYIFVRRILQNKIGRGLQQKSRRLDEQLTWRENKERMMSKAQEMESI